VRPYDATITIRLPATLAEIAAKIGRALDPDTGGDKSFCPDLNETTISTTTPCTSDFAAKAGYMLMHPEVLHTECAKDYAKRWADLVPPTLAECEAFCAGVIPGPVPVDGSNI